DRLRDIADERRDVEDQVARARVLEHVAVQALLHAHVGGVEVAGLDDPRADGAEGVEPLAAEPLPVAELRIARADVVRARVAKDARPLADHDSQLRLGVDVADVRRQHDRIAVAAERVRELAEEKRRLWRLAAGLADVRLVVEPDADDLRVAPPEALAP